MKSIGCQRLIKLTAPISLSANFCELRIPSSIPLRPSRWKSLETNEFPELGRPSFLISQNELVCIIAHSLQPADNLFIF